MCTRALVYLRQPSPRLLLPLLLLPVLSQVALPGDFVPTPFVAAGVSLLGCAVGVMVTASHNTKEYNGYKVTMYKDRKKEGKTVAAHLQISCTEVACVPQHVGWSSGNNAVLVVMTNRMSLVVTVTAVSCQFTLTSAGASLRRRGGGDCRIRQHKQAGTSTVHHFLKYRTAWVEASRSILLPPPLQ